jgi:hypothetical protein
VGMGTLIKHKPTPVSSGSTKVRVCVRTRPLTMREARGRRCLGVGSDRVVVGDKVFAFDDIYDENAVQADIYAGCIAGVIDGCFGGYNATVFAYGQTGSGTTRAGAVLVTFHRCSTPIPCPSYCRFALVLSFHSHFTCHFTLAPLHLSYLTPSTFCPTHHHPPSPTITHHHPPSPTHPPTHQARPIP